jgi:hypothetical protein
MAHKARLHQPNERGENAHSSCKGCREEKQLCSIHSITQMLGQPDSAAQPTTLPFSALLNFIQTRIGDGDERGWSRVQAPGSNERDRQLGGLTLF